MDTLELVTVRELEIAVRIWHPRAEKTLIAWHGLARHGGDFAALARELGPTWRVIAPDTLGRGLSSWSLFPAHDYLYSRYVQTALALLDHFQLSRVAWLGTSMGGLIGLLLAASEEGRDRIERLIVNDIGPEIEAEGLAELASYFAMPRRFGTFGALLEELKSHYAAFGIDEEQAWRRLALDSARRLPDGGWTFHYDPRIAEQFVHDTPRDLWVDWRALTCPVMVVRGAQSALLSPATVERMRETHPRLEVLTVPGCGHAPMLDRPSQVRPIRAFLKRRFPAAPKALAGKSTPAWWHRLLHWWRARQ
ncbi:Pimeloyl-ACP methyl ester carboxylesterase [Modicisalibacter ilicicola DSM 19980]|uniref:Pimeloyl-ACP methyl ester carboxylesterase n=1 Tax=Modicisalibacter ilicicola DSM 19980 TaxID=1121942 RepID=A0A1M4T3Y9_9GAMM|nr:alpha/beta hydrolase [Halomonas ilicicola]SHE39145.1 Pimeloyl-ACP methyl ester carboxylesterase [Halomonas ilicicola DSM 19980]